LLKNILAYCGYSLTSPFFLLLSEHKHCDNMATENASSTMVASLWRSVGTGTKGRWIKYWAHLGCWIPPCYGPFSVEVHFETYEPFISLFFQFFGGPW